MVNGTADETGDRAVIDATGKSPEEWFAILDAAGAAQWSHPKIVSDLEPVRQRLAGWLAHCTAG